MSRVKWAAEKELRELRCEGAGGGSEFVVWVLLRRTGSRRGRGAAYINAILLHRYVRDRDQIEGPKISKKMPGFLGSSKSSCAAVSRQDIPRPISYLSSFVQFN